MTDHFKGLRAFAVAKTPVLFVLLSSFCRQFLRIFAQYDIVFFCPTWFKASNSCKHCSAGNADDTMPAHVGNCWVILLFNSFTWIHLSLCGGLQDVDMKNSFWNLLQTVKRYFYWAILNSLSYLSGWIVNPKVLCVYQMAALESKDMHNRVVLYFF